MTWLSGGIRVLQTKLAELIAEGRFSYFGGEIVLALENLDGTNAGAGGYGGMPYTPRDEWARTQTQNAANQWF
jgi:hypothetical protein